RWFDNSVSPKLAAVGYLGLKYPESYGGQGGDILHEAVMCEEMARVGSGGTAAGIGAHVNIATPPIWKFGTDDQKERYLRPAIAGTRVGALGITEPEDVYVPEENLLGGEDQGFYLIMANFQWERLAMALGAVGAMQVAYERTARFCQERRAFGKPLTGHQAVRHKLVDVATTLHTARCLTYDALRRYHAGE